MNWLVSLALLLASVCTTGALIRCMDDTCSLVDCVNFTVENCAGQIVKNGGYCGCCDSCVTTIAPGESCPLVNLLGVPATQKCTDGYYCNRQSVTCQPLIF